MGFKNKLGRGLAAAAEGVAIALPEALASRSRRETREEDIQRREADRLETRLRDQFNAGDQAGAIEAAEAAGRPELVAMFTGQRTGGEIRALEEAGTSAIALAETASTEVSDAPIDTPEGRSSALEIARGHKAGLTGELARLQSQVDSSSVGADPVAATMDRLREVINEIQAREGPIASIDGIAKRLNAFMDPESLDSGFRALRTAFEAAGLSSEITEGRINVRKRAFQAERDAAFQLLIDPLAMGDPEELRRLIVDWDVSITMEELAEAALANNERRLEEGVTEQERYTNQQRAAVKSDLLTRFNQLDAVGHNRTVAEEMGRQIISDAEAGGYSKLVNTFTKALPVMLNKSATVGRKEWLERARDQYSSDRIRYSETYMTATSNVPMDAVDPLGNKYYSLDAFNKWAQKEMRLRWPDYVPPENEQDEELANSIRETIDQGFEAEAMAAMMNLSDAQRSRVQLLLDQMPPAEPLVEEPVVEEPSAEAVPGSRAAKLEGFLGDVGSVAEVIGAGAQGVGDRERPSRFRRPGKGDLPPIFPQGD